MEFLIDLLILPTHHLPVQNLQVNLNYCTYQAIQLENHWPPRLCTTLMQKKRQAAG
jgi:hypothetical protein